MIDGRAIIRGDLASALAVGIIDIAGFQLAGFIQFRLAVGVVVVHGLAGLVFKGGRTCSGGGAGDGGLHQLQPVACGGVKVALRRLLSAFHLGFALPVVVHKN